MCRLRDKQGVRLLCERSTPRSRVVNVEPPDPNRSPVPGPAIRFDPQRRAAGKPLELAIRDLARFLEHLEGRKRRRTDREHAVHRLAVEAVACNLMAAEMIAPGTAVTIERGHDSIFRKGRYHSPVYGRHFIAVLDTMESAKLITATSGFRISERLRKASTIRATAALATHLPVGKIDWNALGRDDRHEVLILKAAKGPDGQGALIDYVDDTPTNRLRRQVRRLNAHLAKASITVLATLDSHGRAIDPTRRTLTRIFNNGSWEEGGRIGNGAFWTGLSREDRFRLLRIDGEPVASADYRQCQPRVLFAFEGAEQPPGDLYDIRGDGLWRKGWQRLLTACLFAKPPGLRNWPDNCREHFGQNPPRLPEAISELEAKLAPIAHHISFATRVGHRLNKIEGDMILDALEALLRKGITALPVYDCVYVARRHVETAADFMQQAAKRHAGISTPFVKIDRGDDVKDAPCE